MWGGWQLADVFFSDGISILFTTPPGAGRIRTTHSSMSSKAELTALPFVKSLDPTVLWQVLHQLGDVKATNVLDSTYDIVNSDQLALQLRQSVEQPRS